MPGVSLPVTRPTGRTLLVAGPTISAEPVAILRRLGCECVEIDHPYAAMAEIARNPGKYSSLVLSLGSLFREELQIIAAMKRRYPQVEVWMTGSEGRQSTLDESVRLGADGYLAEDGLHRLASSIEKPTSQASAPSAETSKNSPHENASPSERPEAVSGNLLEPVLSADELRALLDEPQGSAPA